MARRRYRSDALSSAAKTRPDQPPSTPESYPLGSEPPASSAPAPAPDEKGEAKPEPTQHFSSGLKDQLAGMQRYASDPIEQYISFHFPGALPVERQWLRANQHHLANPALIHSAAQIALQRGCPRGSPQFMQFCGALLDQHAAAQGHAAPVPEPPPPVHEPEPEPQHTTHIDLEKAESPECEPEESPMTHYAAPVSRSGGERYAMGDYEPTVSSVRLSAEQRDMAHRSMPHLSADEAEKSYAANLIKMQRLQKSGVLK
jgi:hypothetical protein